MVTSLALLSFSLIIRSLSCGVIGGVISYLRRGGKCGFVALQRPQRQKYPRRFLEIALVWQIAQLRSELHRAIVRPILAL